MDAVIAVLHLDDPRGAPVALALRPAGGATP